MKLKRKLKIPNIELSKKPMAVCVSGGLDSAVLLAICAEHSDEVHPFFIRNGHSWENAERRSLARFIKALNKKNIASIVDLEFPTKRALHEIWSGRQYRPGFHQGYSANYIPGRNLALLSAAALPAFARGLEAIALGLLKNNPYPDARPSFFNIFGRAAGSALNWNFKILTPLIHLKKEQVIMLGRKYPLELTLSCVAPVNGLHCGNRCNKCAERQKAFHLAGIPDPARYAGHPPKMDWNTHSWPH
ncbi:MAG: 7-cyano-7-deazaguanine synthase [Elusimicrobia bacterium]|nr:7-cyano-7-deazaguanine synthase [Elusimicrobiota bacterium]